MNDFTFAVRSRLLTLCVIAALAAPARAQNFLCDGIGPRLLNFDLIADKIDARLSPSSTEGEPWSGQIDLRSCTRQSRFQGTYISSFQSGGGPVALVATAAKGAAVRFRKITPGAQYRSFVDGDLVTGGGTVVGDFTPDDIDGTIDTTGLHPLVAECEQAMIDALAASAQFAALPANRSFGPTTVEPFGTFEIDAAPGEVIHFDALTIRGEFDPDFPGLCLDQTRIEIDGGPAVINVDRLNIGNCITLVSDAAIVLNVPGRGPQVRIGRGALFTMPILAPERVISALGTLDDQATNLGAMWGRQIKLRGLVFPSWDFEGCDP